MSGRVRAVTHNTRRLSPGGCLHRIGSSQDQGGSTYSRVGRPRQYRCVTSTADARCNRDINITHDTHVEMWQALKIYIIYTHPRENNITKHIKACPRQSRLLVVARLPIGRHDFTSSTVTHREHFRRTRPGALQRVTCVQSKHTARDYNVAQL